MSLNIKILIFIVCSAGLLMIYYANYSEKQELHFNDIIQIQTMPPEKTKGENLPVRYLISNSQCKMLDPNPWDNSVQKYLTKLRPLTCSNLPPLTYVNRLENSTYTLNILKKNYKKYKINGNHTVKCCYSAVTRLNQNPERYNASADDLIQLSKCEFFDDNFLLPFGVEFILTKCLKYQEGKKKGNEIYKNMHAIAPDFSLADPKLKAKLEKNYENLNKKSSQNIQRLNIIILGVDSVSKLNFYRIMPRTAGYLHQKNWIQLNGYNKIGDNTFPNLMAILSGESMNNLSYWWRNASKKMDDCPFLWKDFGQEGYVSLYAEDTPTISTFNFMRTGFVEKPTDYYMRPFMLAAHENLHQKMLNGLPVCAGPTLVLDHIFNYAKSFFTTFRRIRHFSLLWTNSLSHNDLNAPKALDNSIYSFLNDLYHLGVYENSVVLFLSDHGVRFGSIRETLIGYIEERQPFIFMWFPEWFRERYPEKYSNLLINQNRLTTPYDVHVTLKNVLQMIGNKTFDKAQPEKNGTKPIASACPKCDGLFQVQPLERSCQDASIDLNWCLCSEFRHLDIGGEATKNAASFIYNYIVNRTETLINNLNIKKGLCSKWKLSRIYRSQEVIEQEETSGYGLDDNQVNRSRSRRIFVVIIELNPGRTKFEATVQAYFNAENTTHEFLEYPKRLDGIYKTSKCVKNPKLKYYCYCTKQ